MRFIPIEPESERFGAGYLIEMKALDYGVRARATGQT